MFKTLLCTVGIISFSITAYTQTPGELAVEKYLTSIKHHPKKLTRFFFKMPKGADLHLHLSGASFAENMINYGKNDNLCINPTTYDVYLKPDCPQELQLNNLQKDNLLYDSLIDAWSMRHFKEEAETGHDHFFATFNKFNAISHKHTGHMLSEVAERAGEEHISYLEIMSTLDNNASGKLGAKIGWNDDWNVLREALLQNGLKEIVQAMSTTLQTDENFKNNLLACNTKQAKPGCDVKIRYLYQVLREQPPVQVFAQLLAGFEAAQQEKGVVGINMVQPEDGVISLRDYNLHMRMLNFLNQHYPNVSVSLHAGEIVPSLVKPEDLKFHIRQAVEIAKARRIGHGVDVLNEDQPEALLKEMARKNILVEINLTSNADILKVVGVNHPILAYLKHGVPVALSTDDQAVERTSLSREYKKAALTYSFSYTTLKNFARNSISHSFMKGKNLWQDQALQIPEEACAKDILGAATPSPSCQAFLETSEKAQSQWKLEQQFFKFENKIQNNIGK